MGALRRDSPGKNLSLADDHLRGKPPNNFQLHFSCLYNGESNPVMSSLLLPSVGVNELMSADLL